MSWQKASEHVDKRTGIHHVVLTEPESGAEHHLPILLGEGVAEEFDPRARIAEELALLQRAHDGYEAYAKRHRLPVLTADGRKRAAK